MFKCFLSVCMFLLPMAVFSQQEVKQYVQENTIPIRSISPDSVDFADLEIIGKAVGDARIVMIGEQDHGDGATMLAKTRLVKYLHEKKGFNVLAFEGDFFALNAGWEQIPKQPEAILRFIRGNLHAVWPYCAQFNHLISSYIPATHATSTPIEITGFDSQVGYAFSKAHLKDSIDQYLRRKNIGYTNTPHYQEEFLPYLVKLQGKIGIDKKSKDWIKSFIPLVDTLLSQLGPEAVNEFGYLSLENAGRFAEQLYAS